ncbi:MAG: hypothetical protein ACFFCW_13625 [Candidatus Hodarchaeota archaeon]
MSQKLLKSMAKEIVELFDSWDAMNDELQGDVERIIFRYNGKLSELLALYSDMS